MDKVATFEQFDLFVQQAQCELIGSSNPKFFSKSDSFGNKIDEILGVKVAHGTTY